MYHYEAIALDCRRLHILGKTVLSSVNEANNKMKMQNQSHLFHVWPGRPYKVIVWVVTTLITNKIKSRVSHVTSRGI